MPTLRTTIERAIKVSGKTHYRIALESQLSESVISRFMARRMGLNLESIEKLAPVLGLELVVKQSKSKQRHSRK